MDISLRVFRVEHYNKIVFESYFKSRSNRSFLFPRQCALRSWANTENTVRSIKAIRFSNKVTADCRAVYSKRKTEDWLPRAANHVINFSISFH